MINVNGVRNVITTFLIPLKSTIFSLYSIDAKNHMTREQIKEGRVN